MNKKTKNAIKYYLLIALTGAIAFVAAYLQTPVFGIIATFPLLPFIAFAGGWVPSKWWMFPVFVGIFAYTLRISLMSYGLAAHYYTLACIAIAVLSKCAAYLAKKKKILPISTAVLLLAIGTALHIYMFGNPVQAIQVRNIANDYLAQRYTDEYVVTSLQYDFDLDIYRGEIHRKNDLTNKKHISIISGVVFDEYAPYYEKQLMNETHIKLSKLLKNEFPNDKLTVESLNISTFNKLKIGETHQNLDAMMSFNVLVQADLTPQAYIAKVNDYLKIINYYAPSINTITFTYVQTGVPIHKAKFINAPFAQEFNFEFIIGDFFTNYATIGLTF